jgi:hypothetical protein
MKAVVAALISVLAAPALAHQSSVPHTHPHGLSLLPGLEMVLVIGVLAALALIVIDFRKS